MNIQRATPVHELLARILFLILPTAVVGYFLLDYANAYYAILRNQALQQAIYFAAGMLCSALFHAFRFRFLLPFLALILLFYTGYKGLDQYASGEFDAFFIARAFQVFAILFVTGWIMGWGFIRVRRWSLLVSSLLLSGCIVVISRTRPDTADALLRSFAPALLYSVYLVFTTEQIYSYKDKSRKFWLFLTGRLAGFGILALLLLGTVIYTMRSEIKDTIANHGGGGQEGENSMLQKDKQGHFDLKDYSRLSGSLGRNNELLFCARIDNFFEGTDIPNPLYLTAFHYTLFDTLTETFERDSQIPSNDLFEPDPSSIPLFGTRTDSSVIRNSMGDKLRKTVEIQVYTSKLSPKTYLAPSTGFFVQPITVEKDFRDEFRSAFRAKSYASELNSAYFVYNAEDPQIQQFQEKRFEILRKVRGYEGIDSTFMNYYTDMPADVKFHSIARLADSITREARTPIDKVLAIRDFFLAKDENGDPTFTYTDNPGIPDIPSASKLMYFLFENRQGYCAYYAGATLFMLRSLGIPSRITVGFLTVDRSDKNKGWYWYYADQAHAWVQVYFPGYGWLDFDTTVGNDEAQESPQPDQTPPMQPPKAWLAAKGVVEEVDTAKKTMRISVHNLVFHDREYPIDPSSDMQMDASVALIRRDSIEIPLHDVKTGDTATAVSYAEVIRKMSRKNQETGVALSRRIPSPAPADEIYITRAETGQKTVPVPESEDETKRFSMKNAAYTGMILLITGLLLILLSPTLIFRYYILRHRTSRNDSAKAYFAYRAAGFYLHQTGVYRGNLTPLQYASRVVDPEFGTTFTTFMNTYLKLKYAGAVPDTNDRAVIYRFLTSFIKKVRQKSGFRKEFWSFLKPLRSWRYFFSEADN